MNNLVKTHYRKNNTVALDRLKLFYTNRGYINIHIHAEPLQSGYNLHVFADKKEPTMPEAVAIRQAIKEHKITVQGLANRLRINKNTIFYYMRGRSVNKEKYVELLVKINELYSPNRLGINVEAVESAQFVLPYNKKRRSYETSN